jgi:hypothetical protein
MLVLICTNINSFEVKKNPIGLFWWKEYEPPIIKATGWSKRSCDRCGGKLEKGNYYKYKMQVRTPIGGLTLISTSLCTGCLPTVLDNNGVIVPMENSPYWNDYQRYQVQKIPKHLGDLPQCSDEANCCECKWQRDCRTYFDRTDPEKMAQRAKELDEKRKALSYSKRGISSAPNVPGINVSDYWVNNVNHNFLSGRFFIEKITGHMFYYHPKNKPQLLDPIVCNYVGGGPCTPLSCPHCVKTDVPDIGFSLLCTQEGGLPRGSSFSEGIHYDNSYLE